MRKKIGVIMAMFLCFLAIYKAEAGEIDLLVNKLVEKGVLNPTEAQILVDETQADVAKQNAQGINTSLPSWVQNLQLKGDARVRYQWQKKDTDSTSRNRGRVRFRLGLADQINSKWLMEAGMATGESRSSNLTGNDPRSTNASFLNFFERPEIRLDYADIKYKPNSNFSLVAGKFVPTDYLYKTSELVWDDDINPAGASLAYVHPTGIGDSDVFFNTGAWVLDEYRNKGIVSSDNTNAFGQWLQYGQLGLKGTHGKFDGKVAGTYYNFNKFKGHNLDFSGGGNTKDGSSNLVYDYDAVGASGELGVANLFGGLPFHIDERIGIFGDYIRNISALVPAKNRDGFQVGMIVGSKTVSEKKSWNFRYMYARLKSDAFPDCFTDSDRYSGATNIWAHKFSVNYAIAKNVILGSNWYQSDTIKGVHNTENLLQADLLVKF
ncbi:MAG: putative porin [Candidatus Omnitrophica bacterium]|nr:putative porin [Candidatus Omnitrophota bacterium]